MIYFVNFKQRFYCVTDFSWRVITNICYSQQKGNPGQTKVKIAQSQTLPSSKFLLVLIPPVRVYKQPAGMTPKSTCITRSFKNAATLDLSAQLTDCSMSSLPFSGSVSLPPFLCFFVYCWRDTLKNPPGFPPPSSVTFCLPPELLELLVHS